MKLAGLLLALGAVWFIGLACDGDGAGDRTGEPTATVGSVDSAAAAERISAATARLGFYQDHAETLEAWMNRFQSSTAAIADQPQAAFLGLTLSLEDLLALCSAEGTSEQDVQQLKMHTIPEFYGLMISLFPEQWPPRQRLIENEFGENCLPAPPGS